MGYLRRFARLIYINYILLKHGLDEVILNSPLFIPFKFIAYLSFINCAKKKNIPRGQRIREAIEELGPIFIKFGQILSTRLDVLPSDIARELVKLQDDVPPFPGDLAVEFIEQSLRKNIAELFLEFDLKPLASASIAQVHPAKLHNGKEVVVKVLRPNIKKQINQDIVLLELLARITNRYSSWAKRFKVREIVNEFKKCIFDELDLMREAANASQLRRNFANSDLLFVPEIYWDYTKHNVLVMERIYGTQVSNIRELRANNVNLERLAKRGVEIFFTQVFRDCFFHADMHPGNVWVSIADPDNPTYIALDFGIIGTLSPDDQRYIAENLLAFFNRDYRKVAELHIASGWVPASTRVDEFESEIRTVCEPIFERPLKEISFGKTLMRLFQTARRFDMQIQPQLILLQKTLISVEGLGRQLYPDLDLWNTAKPFLEEWMKKQIGFQGFISKLKNHAPYWLEKLPELPSELLKLINSQSFSASLLPRMPRQRTATMFDSNYSSNFRSSIYNTNSDPILKPKSNKYLTIFIVFVLGISLTTVLIIGVVLGVSLTTVLNIMLT